MKYTIPEIQVRTIREIGATSSTTEDAEAVAEIARAYFEEAQLDYDREHLICIHLNQRNMVTSISYIGTGTVSACIAHPREIFRVAVKVNCSSLILVHNHPTGETDPSTADIKLTKRISEAGEIVGIPLTDHVIIGPEKTQFNSLRKMGVIH